MEGQRLQPVRPALCQEGALLLFRKDAVRQNPSISLKTKRLILPFGLLLGTAFLSGLAWADTALTFAGEERGRASACPRTVYLAVQWAWPPDFRRNVRCLR